VETIQLASLRIASASGLPGWGEDGEDPSTTGVDLQILIRQCDHADERMMRPPMIMRTFVENVDMSGKRSSHSPPTPSVA